MLAAAGDSAAPWIAFGTVLFGAFLGAAIMAHKGRSVGWGFVVGLALSVIGAAILLGVPEYTERKSGWEWDRDRQLRALFGLLALGCLITVIALLVAVTTEGAARGHSASATQIQANDWKSSSCPAGFTPREPTPGLHHSNGPCRVEMADGSLYRCNQATALVAGDGSSKVSFRNCSRVRR